MSEDQVKALLQVVTNRIASNLDELALLCASARSSRERIAGYEVSAQQVRDCLTGGSGWMLDLQEEIDKLIRESEA